MAKSFTIEFRYPLEGLEIYLEAQVELHHSDPYYRVTGFRRVHHSGASSTDAGAIGVLQPVEVKLHREGEQLEWVHKDSCNATSLSVAIGKAIEKEVTPEISEQ